MVNLETSPKAADSAKQEINDTQSKGSEVSQDVAIKEKYFKGRKQSEDASHSKKSGSQHEKDDLSVPINPEEPKLSQRVNCSNEDLEVMEPISHLEGAIMEH